MTDEEIQTSTKIWVAQIVAAGHSLPGAFSRIVKNAESNVRLLSDLIQQKKDALAGVSAEMLETALEPFYSLVRREERIMVNARTVQNSGWKPEGTN